MLYYKGKELTQYAEKQGGKNKNPVDGFYVDEEGIKYFVKKPADSKELFTELFAGLILQEFISRGLIPKKYFPALICADLLDFGDNSYGLIQPCVEFEELHKLINTSTKNGKDRSPITETFYGPVSYANLTKTDSFGLSMALMFSLLLGAHSVHSANIVVLPSKKNKTQRQFARLDWGDAFRYFAHPQNNDDLLYAYENRGINFKRLTKDYFLNYRAIQGIFPAIALKASNLADKIPSGYFAQIILSALKRIPANLLNKKTQNALAEYMCIPSFAEVHFSENEQGYQEFAQDMAKVCEERLRKMTRLQDINNQQATKAIYDSKSLSNSSLLVSDSTNFISQVKKLEQELDTLDYQALDIKPLIVRYNQYLEQVAKDCELYNLWDHDHAASTANLFASYYNGKGEEELGHAFIAQYKESAVLRRMYNYDPVSQNSLRFKPFEFPCKRYVESHPQSTWELVSDTMQSGTMILSTLKQCKRRQEEGIELNPETLRGYIKEFLKLTEQVNSKLNPAKSLCLEPNAESRFFYPISLEQLKTMTGDQLTTICLEEMNAAEPSRLAIRIIQNDELWTKVEGGLASASFHNRQDDIPNKRNRLIELRKLVLDSKAQVEIEDLQQAEAELMALKAVRRRYSRENQMLSLKSQLKIIEEKVDDLKARNKDAAAQAAEHLLNKIQEGVHHYINSTNDEQQDLSHFITDSLSLIEKAKPILGQHRSEWIYILQNLAIAVLLLGVGYIPAAFINKYYTGNYTFFAKTDSLQKAEDLERVILSVQSCQAIT